jgi:hypothetical protein
MVKHSQTTVALRHGDFETVKFTDRDNHVFFMKMGKAIESCRRLRELEADLEHDELELCGLLDVWFKDNQSLFTEATVKPTGAGLIFYFAPEGEEFSVALSMKLAELETESIARLSAFRIETRQVSCAELEELREIEKIRQHAEHAAAHQPVEA